METNTILKKIYKRTLLQYIAYTVGLLVVFVLAVYLAAFFDFQWVYGSMPDPARSRRGTPRTGWTPWSRA